MSERRDILNMEVTSGASTISINLEDDLAFSMDNLNKAFIEQSAKFAYWATVSAQAKHAVEAKKLEVDKLEDYLKKTLIGELDTKVREEMDNNGEKITESKVQSRIYTHPQYRATNASLFALKQELIELQKQYYLLDVGKQAMEQRKDSLISLGALLRSNSISDVTIK